MVETKTINQFTNGKKPSRIYVGMDNTCRCGCRGHYADPGSRRYNGAMNRLEKMLTTGDAKLTDSGQGSDDTICLNFSHGNGRAITLYLKRTQRADAS